jgi:hypothetical protein
VKKHCYTGCGKIAPETEGVALVLTLLVVAMLTVVMVAFNAMTRTELMASRNFSKSAGATAYASMADQEAVALLTKTLSQAGTKAVITQPGRAIVWETSTSFDVVPLSSAALTNKIANTNVDLNAPVWRLGTSQVSAITNSLAPIVLLTNTNMSNYFSVPWVQVTNTAGQVAGRYAFWIDDEGSKFNLNYASTNTRPSFYPTNVRPWDARQLDFGGAGEAQSNFLLGFAQALTFSSSALNMPTWGYVFAPEQIKAYRTNAIQQLTGAAERRAYSNSLVAWNSLQFQVGGGSGSLTNRLPLAGMGRDPLGGVGFLNANANASVVDAYLKNKIDTPALLSRFGEGFAEKYGTNVVRQLVVNINDFFLPAEGDNVLSYTGGRDLLSEVSTGEGFPVPRSFFGVRRAPFLNEVFIGAAYHVTNAPTDRLGHVEVQLWMQCEIVDPYRSGLGAGWVVKYKIADVDYSGRYDYEGETRPFSAPPEGRKWNFDGGSLAQPIGAVPADTNYYVPAQAFAFEFQTYFPSDIVTNSALVSNVVLDSVTIRASMAVLRADPNDPFTVRDWAFDGDFEEITVTNPSLVSEALGRDQFGPRVPPAGLVFAHSIAKNDPRTRRFPTYTPPSPAWQERTGAGVTLGGPNSTVVFNVEAGGLPSDSAPVSVNIYTHPSFASTSNAEAATGPLSVFDLGQVPTGLPWRTLHMHSQPTNEGARIPDWVLLDAFAVTNAWIPVATRLNPNALPYPALTNWGGDMLRVLQASNRPLVRAAPYLGLLSGFTNQEAAAAATVSLGSVSNTVAAELPVGTAFPTNAIGAIATNLATMRFTDHWRTHPGRTGTNFPAGIYGSLAEIVEVAGVSDSTNEAKNVREARARVIYESLSPYSDTFTIYSIGQSWDGSTVTGETKTRTQVKRMPNGTFRPVFSMPLLAPD